MKNKDTLLFQDKQENGKATIIVLIVLAIAAVGGLAYYSGKLKNTPLGKNGAVAQTAQTDTPGTEGGEEQTAQAGKQQGEIEIKPGNPVVAKINGEDVTRIEVFKFIQTLPPATRQLPIQQLFPMALEQVINAKIIGEKTENVKLDNDPEVKAQLEQAKKNIVRSVYLQKEIEERLTEKRLKEAYEQYKANFPEIQEVKAQHILVEDKALAGDLIKNLEDGAEFAELAKKHSIDGTAKSGGELGYFTEQDVVPEFAKVAFSVEPGTYTKEPVKTDFGYHIIKVEDKRIRPVPEFEQAKPFLEPQLRQIILAEIVEDWREDKDIKRFDINGEEIEPAAGETAPEETEEPTE